MLKYLAKHLDVNKARNRANKNSTIDGAITAVLGATSSSDPKKTQKKPAAPVRVKKEKEKDREQKKREVEDGEIESEKPVKVLKRDTKV